MTQEQFKRMLDAVRAGLRPGEFYYDDTETVCSIDINGRLDLKPLCDLFD